MLSIHACHDSPSIAEPLQATIVYLRKQLLNFDREHCIMNKLGTRDKGAVKQYLLQEDHLSPDRRHSRLRKKWLRNEKEKQ